MPANAVVAFEADGSLHLLQRARAGDRTAMDVLLRRYLPVIRRWATGRLPAWARDANDTDDLIQDALLKTLRQMDDFSPAHDGALQAYLRRAVLNRIRDEYRRAKRRPPGEPMSDYAPSRDASPLEVLIGHEALGRYERALASLKHSDAEAIIARVELGQSYEEMTRVLGKPNVHATRVTVWRALARLARAMEREETSCGA